MSLLLHFIDHLGAGGKERQCVELVKVLVRQGHQVCVVSMEHGLFYKELETLPGVRIEYLVRQTRFDPKIFLAFLRLCRQLRPDIITAWHSMPAVYAIPAAVLLRIPMVSAFIQDAPTVLSRGQRLRSQLAFRFSRAIVGNSSAGIRSYAPPPARTVLIPTGYDLARLGPDSDAGILRGPRGLGTARIVGMVASFSEFKDQPTLIRAAQRILRTRQDVVFVFVGSGPTLPACQAMLDNDTERGHILFLGAVPGDTVEKIVRDFDIGALATFTEGISNSIVEYMALRKPVVATDGGGTSDLVEEGASGFLVPAGDVDSLEARIRQLLDDHALCRRMGEHGRQRIVRDFLIGDTLEKFCALYRRLLSRAPLEDRRAA